MSNFRSLGIIGAGGSRQIEREQIVIDQVFERTGAAIVLSVDDFDGSQMPEGSTVDLLIKDNQYNERTYITVGDVRHVDLSSIKHPLKRPLDPRRSEIFFKVVAPDGRIAAQSERVKLSGGDCGIGDHGNAAGSSSAIKTQVDPDQTLPCIAMIESEHPTISFGPYGVNNTAEVRADHGCMTYALTLAVEKFIYALISPGGDELTGKSWDGLRANIVQTLGKPDWETVLEENANDKPMNAAHNIMTVYYKNGELKKIVDKLTEEKAAAEENEE